MWNYTYEQLLKKVRKELPEITYHKERFEVPRVKGGYQGKFTIITNFKQIADYIGRDPSHLLKFLAGELATQARLHGTRAEFTGRFTSDEINKKIQLYVNKFVICNECGKPDTKLVKEDRITYMVCMACGSKKPVKSLK